MDLIVLDPTENPAEDALLTTPIRKHLDRHRPACFKKEMDADGICWLTFDTPESAANVWNAATLDEFDCHVEDIHRDSTVRALVLQSSKDRVFIAGADLKAVQTLPEEERQSLLLLGQDVFTHLETLRIPKIALIHGACVGGGFETALACDCRIASDSEATRIGLPEVMLGLIPGWGGCTRLPRLIGLPKAMDLILRGKVVKPSEAKRLGLVHHVVPKEHLRMLARKVAMSSSPEKHRHFHASQIWPVPQILRIQALASLKGKHPWMRREPSAHITAVEVITRGAARTVEGSLALEQTALKKLAGSPATRSFIQTFMRKEAASKKLPPSLARYPARALKHASVIGAGVMGSGIAYALACKGASVLWSDTSTEAMARGVARTNQLFHTGVKQHALTRKQAREAHDRIAFFEGQAPLTRADLVIEAVVENMETKRQLFANLASRTRPDTILATNTSALSVTEMAKEVPHPERVIGLHFFNPAHLMPLVEVVTHDHSSPEVVATAVRFVQSLGKTPIVVRDRPGFVVNRILMPYLLGAVQLAESMRDPWELDDAMTEFGMPMGPLRLLDEVGFDVALHVETTLRQAYPENIPPAPLLQRLMEAGMLGRKNGHGFYVGYEDKHGPQPNPEVMRFLKPRALTLFPTLSHIATHLHELMQAEARRCVEEGVAASASDVELAMSLGSGYPPFRTLFPHLTSS